MSCWLIPLMYNLILWNNFLIKKQAFALDLDACIWKVKPIGVYLVVETVEAVWYAHFEGTGFVDTKFGLSWAKDYVFVDVEPVLGWGLIIEDPVQLKGKFVWKILLGVAWPAISCRLMKDSIQVSALLVQILIAFAEIDISAFLMTDSVFVDSKPLNCRTRWNINWTWWVEVVYRYWSSYQVFRTLVVPSAVVGSHCFRDRKG